MEKVDELVRIIVLETIFDDDRDQRRPQDRTNLPCPDAGQDQNFIYVLPCKAPGQIRDAGQGRARQDFRAL